MRRIILHAANAARNSYACFSVPLCYWVGLGRWRFSTSLSPVRDCSFRAATSRPLSVTFGGPENPWGWASRVATESASSRPIDPAPARARVQHASVKKEMTRSIVDGVADLSRRSAKSPEKSTEIGGTYLRRAPPCAATVSVTRHDERRSERTRGLVLRRCYSLEDRPKDHL
jgi:hypothetical protein